jgi:hypothetical protein
MKQETRPARLLWINWRACNEPNGSQAARTLPRDSEEIGCCLPALLDNLHGPNRKDRGPRALSQNDDLHVEP